MLIIFQCIYLLALSIWTGGMIFFSAIVTPSVFRHLPKEVASEFLSALFPIYYTFGYTAASICLLTTFVQIFLMKQLLVWRLILLTIMTVCTFYAGLSILPKAHQIKQELKIMEDPHTEIAEQKKQTFTYYHRISVTLNLVIMLAGILCLIEFTLKRSV